MRRIKQQIKEERDRILNDATEEALDIAKSLCPVDSGQLRNDIQREEYTIFNTLDYAPFVHNGTAYQPPTKYIEAAMIQVANKISE